MSDKIRLDVYLVSKGLADSRTHAQALIKEAQVYHIENGQKLILKKPSIFVSEEMQIQVESGPANRYVSRGGLKLEGALKQTQLDVSGWNVLDVGISTGGFTDCLLQRQAKFVLGVDVGHGQVHRSLLENPQLKVLEGVNARLLSELPEVINASPAGGFDLVVMDVSFISISLIIPQIVPSLKKGGFLLSLVKPQFEVGIDGLGKGGIVKEPELYQQVEDKTKSLCEKSGLIVCDYFMSSIQGKDGNNEFFILAKKS